MRYKAGNIFTGNTLADSLPFIVEVIGLAGAGKSTLSQALCQQDSKMFPGEYLYVWNVRHMPYMIRHALLSLPTFLRQPRNGRWFTGREITKMLYLRGWHRTLKQHSCNNEAVIISDQGPIYEMATLHAFGPGRLHSASYRMWWEKMFNQWAQTIDLVIWLDAPEEVLIERIRSRDQWHPVKESSTQEMRDYLFRYGSAYEHIISELSAIREIQVLRFNTGCQALEDITSLVRQKLNKQL